MRGVAAWTANTGGGIARPRGVVRGGGTVIGFDEISGTKSDSVYPNIGGEASNCVGRPTWNKVGEGE